MKKIRFLAVNVSPEIKLKISSYLGDRYDFSDGDPSKGVYDVYIIEDDFNLCKRVKKQYPSSDVLLIISDTDLKRVRFIEEYEIDEVLVKPVTQDQMKFCLLRIIERFRSDFEYQLDKIEDDLGIVGSSEYIRGLREKIKQAAPGDFPVLILGDSGTGKELVARALHKNSGRGENDMVTINCAAVPKHLEESHFFGHKRGSFTGANADSEGFFGAADGSTLFLDEIGETSLEIQAKLLRVLDSGEYIRVGDTKSRQTNIRVISATNRDLGEMVEEKTFREDLYYRIRGITIETRPLKDHKEDIPELVHVFLPRDDVRAPRKFTATAMRFLMEYSWPGNIRELKHMIQYLSTANLGRTKIDVAIRSFLKIKENRDDIQPYREAKEELVNDWEMHYFTNLLARSGGNIAQAARAAKMYRPNLNKKLKDLGISADRFKL